MIADEPGGHGGRCVAVADAWRCGMPAARSRRPPPRYITNRGLTSPTSPASGPTPGGGRHRDDLGPGGNCGASSSRTPKNPSARS